MQRITEENYQTRPENENYQTRKPFPYILHPTSYILNPQLYILNPQPSTLNPQPSILNQAQFRVGSMLMSGQGCEKNAADAVHYFNLASQGDITTNTKPYHHKP